jgi:hypothetical protein
MRPQKCHCINFTGDYFMRRRYLKVALDSNFYGALCRQADTRGITLSDLVRECLNNPSQSISVEKILARVEEKLMSPVVAVPLPVEVQRLLLEILLLVRELAAERNTQILARVAQQVAAREKKLGGNL